MQSLKTITVALQKCLEILHDIKADGRSKQNLLALACSGMPWLLPHRTHLTGSYRPFCKARFLSASHKTLLGKGMEASCSKTCRACSVMAAKAVMGARTLFWKDSKMPFRASLSCSDIHNSQSSDLPLNCSACLSRFGKSAPI